MTVCRFCEAEFNSPEECVKHEIIFHQFEPNFTLKCNFKNCPATFKVVSSYYSHRSRHKTVHNSLVPDQPLNVGEIINNDEIINDDGISNDDGQDSGSERGDEPMVIDNNGALLADLSLKALCAKYLLYTRSNSSMPHKVLMDTMVHVVTIVKSSLAKYAKEVKENLVEQGVVPEDFQLPGPSQSNVFEGLQSIYLQDQYFKESLNVVQPRHIDLEAQRAVISGSSMSGNRKIKLQSPHMMYIPVIETLTNLLKDPTIVDLMSENQGNDPAWYASFVDGDMFKNSQFFKDHPDALRVIFYYDDWELCESLGSRTHAVGVLYMSLDNIPAQYRSNLKFIHLVGTAEKKYIQASGIDKFLEQAVLDIKKLEQGVVIADKLWYGCLIAFTADNLGSHSVGGFKEGFTAAHPCRTCIAPLLDVRTCTEARMFELRNERSHREHIRLLMEAPSKQRRNELSMEFGINRESFLNELVHFSVVKNLPPDAMHDLLEGCYPITIKFLLSKIVDDGILSLQQINELIKDFDYGYSEVKSRPAEIKPQHLDRNGNLRQSASEMWQLGVMLPLIIGPHVDVECEYYNVYLSLLQVSMIIMARKIPKDILGFLELKLTEYTEGFLKCYRDTLIPKQHYLLHYVYYIQVFGPVSPLWNMRMEARHQFFKRLAKKMKNFKNISFSLANRNQLWEASQRFSLFQKAEVSLCGTGVGVVTASSVYKAFLPDGWDFVVEVSYVEVNNVMLVAKECCLCVDFDFEEAVPIFALPHAIIMKDSIPYLVCKEMVTLFFDSHLNAYQVEVSDSYKLLQMKDLYSEAVFHWHTVHDKKYIIVKRALGPLY